MISHVICFSPQHQITVAVIYICDYLVNIYLCSHPKHTVDTLREWIISVLPIMAPLCSTWHKVGTDIDVNVEI